MYKKKQIRFREIVEQHNDQKHYLSRLCSIVFIETF